MVVMGLKEYIRGVSPSCAAVKHQAAEPHLN